MKRLKSETIDYDEKDLVERLLKGQQWAFNTLVDKYQDRLLKTAYSITFDAEEAREIVQDVFLIVFKKIDTFRQESGLAGWLRKITINQCLNWKRKWKRRFRWQHDPIEAEDHTHPHLNVGDVNDPETLVREKQAEAQFLNAVKKLPEKIRVVFVLNALEGLSYGEIAAALDINPGTVSSRLCRARKMILESMA